MSAAVFGCTVSPTATRVVSTGSQVPCSWRTRMGPVYASTDVVPSGPTSWRWGLGLGEVGERHAVEEAGAGNGASATVLVPDPRREQSPATAHYWWWALPAADRMRARPVVRAQRR